MTIRLLKFCLYAAVIVTALASCIALVTVIAHGVGGSAATTTLQLRIDPAESTVVKDAGGAAVGTLLLNQATLNVRSGGAAYASLQALDILLTCGLWIGVFTLILKLISQIGAGNPFNQTAVRRLRSVGWMLIALNLWSFLRMLALPPLLLSNLQATAGDFRILPMISASVSGLRNARVDGQFGLGLLVAGALALLLSEAFRLGTAMREDNESIL